MSKDVVLLSFVKLIKLTNEGISLSKNQNFKSVSNVKYHSNDTTIYFPLVVKKSEF